MSSAARSLQSRLEEVRAPEPVEGPSIVDPVRLLRHLEASGRFHRDRRLGRIFHPGRVSLRENEKTDSLHIVVHDNHLTAHVDRVSPLGAKPEQPPKYSLRAATVHNVAGMAHDLLRLLRGRQGDHRAHLHSEWLWEGTSRDVAAPDNLLDPVTSAWSVHLEARVAGNLEELRLRTAIVDALGREAFDHDPLDVVDCADDDALDSARTELLSWPAPVSDWPPLRARLARHPDGDVLMLNLNHAASDGFGAVAVLRSIADAYAGHARNGLRPDFLATQDLPVRPSSGNVPLPLHWYQTVVEQLRDRLANPARLAPDHPTDEPGYGIHQLQLSPQDTERVVNANRPGTSRNILLASLHLAIGDWNLRHGTPGRRVGVLVPVNLRPQEFSEEVIGNFSVTARVSTSRRQRAGRASALKAVTAETTRNKRTRTGIALVAALDRSGLLPLWAKQSLVVLQPLTRNRKVDTAMLANLGWIEEPPSFGRGAGKTTEMWFSVPARAPDTLCIGAVTINDRLHLVMRYPHRLFSPDAARRFTDYYLAQIRLLGNDGW